MVFAFFSVVLLFSTTKAVGSGRRLLSQNDNVGCHCHTFAEVAAEFCTDDHLKGQNWQETCFEVQDYINVGLGLFKQIPECHVDLCSTEDEQFFQHEDLESGRLDAACTSAALAGAERRRLHHTRGGGGCFDENSKVVLKDGSEITIQNANAGSWIQTCQPGVFTPVLANVDHQEDGVPMKELQFENGFSLVLTSSHMVYSKGELIPVYAVQPGSIVDGKTIVAITNVTGHPANVVTLRQDILVNGVCATWMVEEYMPVARLQFVWNAINHIAPFFPNVVFATTQAIADVFVPLLDGGIIGPNTILAVMFSTGFLLFCTSATMLFGSYAVLHVSLGQWSQL